MNWIKIERDADGFATDECLECHIHKRGDCNIILIAPLIRYAISIATDNINYAIAKFNLILRDLAGDILETKGALPSWHNGKDIQVTYIDHTREDFVSNGAKARKTTNL